MDALRKKNREPATGRSPRSRGPGGGRSGFGPSQESRGESRPTFNTAGRRGRAPRRDLRSFAQARRGESVRAQTVVPSGSGRPLSVRHRPERGRAPRRDTVSAPLWDPMWPQWDPMGRGAHLGVMKSYEIQRNPTKSDEIRRNPTKSEEIPRNPTRRSPTESYEIRRNPTKSYEIQRNATKSCEIPRNPTKFSEVRRNPTKSDEILRNPSKSNDIL